MVAAISLRARLKISMGSEALCACTAAMARNRKSERRMLFPRFRGRPRGDQTDLRACRYRDAPGARRDYPSWQFGTARRLAALNLIEGAWKLNGFLHDGRKGRRHSFDIDRIPMDGDDEVRARRMFH